MKKILRITAAAAALCMSLILMCGCGGDSPEKMLVKYMSHISAQEYEEMYEMIDAEASGGISQEDFIQRNSAIYEGIGMENMTIEILKEGTSGSVVKYTTSFDTSAGKISFANEAEFVRSGGKYLLLWKDSLIFPQLGASDKVRVYTEEAGRGQIYDRNGRLLAGNGFASSVGIVPGKLQDRETALAEIAALLETEVSVIEKKLSAQWVKDDSFVPIKTVPKVDDGDLLVPQPSEEALRERDRQDALLSIPGVMITDVGVREYPLGEAASHLTGYVQNVTAEDLEEHAGEGYTASSVIGKAGMESLFEETLRGQNGCRIYIIGEDGTEKSELIRRDVRHGEDIKLTIDSTLQTAIYEQFKEDKSCTAAMDPYTGEVLALVSTPSYDSNDFVLGMSDIQWNTLNEDGDKPMYNRFRQVWCPGSSFKPVTAAVSVETGAVDPAADMGSEGLSWQKDSSWGKYKVTTLHEYSPVTMRNALIYSDNIYFAKAALAVGDKDFEKQLQQLGFNEELPFDIKMSASQYSNTEHIETEIQLADSGYGQGEVLVNPLHLACIYTAFCNAGSVKTPYLVYQGGTVAEDWIPGAFSPETAAEVLEGLKGAVNDPAGTGYSAHRDDILLAGKTGTAEIKASKEDSAGTELGWFAVFTPDSSVSKPILMVTMTEDVKNRGGSGYVVRKSDQVLDQWFTQW